MIATLAFGSWILPERRWHGFAERLARLRIALRGCMSDEELATVRVVVGDQTADWINKQFWPKALTHKYLSWMQILACHGPRRWQPTSRLIGKEHVDLALGQGRGVVLLTATFAYKDLMAKAAFAQAGYAINHLSKDSHGFSETRFGKRWLNPIYTSIEMRHLEERMVFSGSNTKDVAAKVRERLRQNRPVMITVTPLGRQVATRRFINGHIHVATGGLNFACENKTPVLPVFTLRRADGGMTTIVGPALDQPENADRAERIDAILDDYVPKLESQVRAEPEQFSFPLNRQSGKPLITTASAPEPASLDVKPAVTAA